MQSFFHHVLRESRVYSKLLAEIDAAFDSGRVSRPVQYSEAVTQLPYFQACLKEAMRVRPAVGLNITRHVPPGGAEIDGQWYPGGTRCALNGWVLHRDKAVFGQDADIYRPERWTDDEERAKFMDKYMCQVRQSQNSFICLRMQALTDVVLDSSEAAATFASAKTLRCLRSTRSVRFC
jgi:cytochrome P450